MRKEIGELLLSGEEDRLPLCPKESFDCWDLFVSLTARRRWGFFFGCVHACCEMYVLLAVMFRLNLTDLELPEKCPNSMIKPHRTQRRHRVLQRGLLLSTLHIFGSLSDMTQGVLCSALFQQDSWLNRMLYHIFLLKLQIYWTTFYR